MINKTVSYSIVLGLLQTDSIVRNDLLIKKLVKDQLHKHSRKKVD